MSELSGFKFKASCDIMPHGFWSAIDVWINKPHVLNKRLCGVKLEESREVDRVELENSLSALWGNATEDVNSVLSYLNVGFESNSPTHADQNRRWSVGVRTMVPKVNSYGAQSHKDIIVKDAWRQRVIFLPFQENEEGHTVPKKSNFHQIQLEADNSEEDWCVSVCAWQPDGWFSDGVVYPKLPWLSGVLLPKLAQWATESRRSEFKSTLSLIPLEKYGCRYQELKDKYREMVKVWPEVTDPEKFVYEDVAIATYLLVLWEGEREERGLTDKQSFLDLGCGNGLLVHILSNEGHPGKGIDVRKRKIWDMYGPQTCLEERAITPSALSLFPDVDWLIGNHSDELTPWIPVIASRSSFACRYFVLPCCFFDFYGKYQRRQCRKSQYKEYIDFVSEISSLCGFRTEEDCLRIPSTKRVCLIGMTRTYELCQEAEVDQQRTRFIQARLPRTVAPPGGPEGEGGRAGSGGCWGEGFQPRDRIQVTRNCARLPRDFIERVVLLVGRALLALSPEDPPHESAWNPGGTGGGSLSLLWGGQHENDVALLKHITGSLSVREVAQLLDRETLLALKKECGGLQTLLKNSHQVFKVAGGRVQIRDWREAGEGGGGAPARRRPPGGAEKTRLCWFHTHHPQGCPLPPERCGFAHGPHDLRPPANDLRPPAHDLQPPAHDLRPPANDLQPPAHELRPPANNLRPPVHEPHDLRPPAQDSHDLRPPAHNPHDLRPPAHIPRPPTHDPHDLQPPAPPLKRHRSQSAAPAAEAHGNT